MLKNKLTEKEAKELVVIDANTLVFYPYDRENWKEWRKYGKKCAVETPVKGIDTIKVFGDLRKVRCRVCDIGKALKLITEESLKCARQCLADAKMTYETAKKNVKELENELHADSPDSEYEWKTWCVIGFQPENLEEYGFSITRSKTLMKKGAKAKMEVSRTADYFHGECIEEDLDKCKGKLIALLKANLKNLLKGDELDFEKLKKIILEGK